MDDVFRAQLAGLVRYVRPHKKVLLASVGLSVVSTALGMVQPLFARFLIDRVLLGKNFSWLAPLLALVVSLLIAGFLVRILNSMIYTRYSASVLFQMREDLFSHLQRVPLSFLSRKKIGDVYSRLASDMADIQALVTETVPGFVFNLLTVLLTALILFWLNWRMALLSFCGLPPAMYLIRCIRPRLVELTRRMAETNAEIAHFLFESLAGTSIIRAFGAENLESQKLSQKHRGLLDVLVRSQILRGFSGSIPILYTILNTLVVYGYGGYLVMNGSLTLGSLVAFAFYQGRVFGPLQGLMDGFLALQTSRVALSRVDEIWQVKPAFRSEGGLALDNRRIRGALEFDQVCFAYEPENQLLRNLSFQVPAGQITAVVGPSGVGKTTICHLMTRLFDPDSGRICLDGVDIRTIAAPSLRKHVALVSQDTFLFHTTILDNIRFAKPQASCSEVVAAAEAAGIHEFIQSLPEGYDTLVGDRGVRLSGGQKQRISFARAVLMAPSILILDEPTAFLDPTSEERLKNAFRQLMQGKTIVLVSHRISTIRDAQRIVALNQRGLAYAGTAAEFFAEQDRRRLTEDFADAVPDAAGVDGVSQDNPISDDRAGVEVSGTRRTHVG
jgi:ATP-binding cassette subfamily B protein